MGLGLLMVALGLWGDRSDARAIPFPADAPWFNVTRPLTSASLRGRFVLLDFFTPGCINCIETVPSIARIQHRFARDLVVIGVDSPKFAASRHRPNVRAFLRQYAIHHPVVIDRHFTLWHAYHVFAWPTFVLIGPRGHVRHTWIGQGHHAAIARALIAGIRRARSDLRPGRPPGRSPSHRGVGLQGPEKIAVDRRFVAVADTRADRILLFDHHGRLVRTIGSGRPGLRNGSARQARFDHPQGLAFAGPSLYVADTMNNAIRCIDLATGQVTTIEAPPLNAPWALQRAGPWLYIAMAGDHQIWRMRLPHGPPRPWAGVGAEGLRNGPLSRAFFAQPMGLAYAHGVLYVADAESSSVRAIVSGTVRTLIGRGLFHFGHRNGPADHALLQHDQGLAILSGNLYIADTFNDRIERLDLGTHEVTTVMGTGRTGRRLGQARAAELDEPAGLAVLGARTLLIADTGNNRILALDLETGVVGLWAR